MNLGKDHPRACGEKETASRIQRNCRGSPPRMRGKVPVTVFLCFCAGITPAHAGKSCIAVRISQEQKDHPRVCGEKLILYTDRCVKPGSPPRVRGKGTSTRWRETAGRITPACAGKSVHPLHNSVMHGDHPRVCGEKHAVPVSAIWSAGSPPRVRGKASCILVSSSTVGITPAYAGKRSQ